MDILITEDEFSKMRQNATTNNILGEEKIEEYEKRLEQSKTDYIEKLRLFIDCLSLLTEKRNQYLSDDPETYMNVTNVLEGYDLITPRSLIHKFDVNKTLGNYYARLDIEEFVEHKQEDIDYILRFFYNIFGKEDLF